MDYGYSLENKSKTVYNHLGINRRGSLLEFFAVLPKMRARRELTVWDLEFEVGKAREDAAGNFLRFLSLASNSERRLCHSSLASV